MKAKLEKFVEASKKNQKGESSASDKGKVYEEDLVRDPNLPMTEEPFSNLLNPWEERP